MMQGERTDSGVGGVMERVEGQGPYKTDELKAYSQQCDCVVRSWIDIVCTQLGLTLKSKNTG